MHGDFSLLLMHHIIKLAYSFSLQAKAANVSVSDVASVLSTAAGSPPPVGGPAALVAANKAYGATAAALANVSG